MTNRRRGWVGLAWAVLLAALVSLPATAVADECEDAIAAVAERMREVQAQVDALPAEDRDTPQRFLDDAREVLDKARTNCAYANDALDRGLAFARVGVARANVEAAAMVLRVQ